MDERARAKALLAYYREKRADDQREYYRNKARDYRKLDTRLRFIAGLLTLSVVPLTAVVQLFFEDASSNLLLITGVIMAIIPAASSALLTARNINQYQSFQHLYHRTYLNLARLIREHEPSSDDPQLSTHLKEYIALVEDAIADENTEWRKQGGRVKPADVPQSGS